MNNIVRIAKFAATVFISVLTVAFFIAALLWLARIALPYSAWEDIRQKINKFTNIELIGESGVRYTTMEEVEAFDIQKSTYTWMTRCVGEDKLSKLPCNMTAVLAGPVSNSCPRDSGETIKETDGAIRLHNVYFRVLNLSNLILARRIATDRKLATAYTTAMVGAFLSIVIGLLTTVFVGLSSSEFGKKENRWGYMIRLGALILPAIGTATAAAIAFFDPNGNLARQNQLALGLQQLHYQLAATAWKIECPKTAEAALTPTDDSRLETFNQRFQDLIFSAGDSQSTGQSSGSKKSNPLPGPTQP
ncbi:hypothetical protein BSFA1_09180 [Burkholderia sp. SFA1]|nr:hypothetical protein BSFA1_09180 [Burkholderia sp. SFA1]